VIRSRERLRSSLRRSSREGQAKSSGEHGQGLVEFALVSPLLFVLFLGTIEFALAFNASLSVNRASQNAAHIAASAGTQLDADCLILQEIERDVWVPNSAKHILEVVIGRASPTGDQVFAQQRWSRGGSTDCALIDGSSIKLEFTLVESGFPPTQRCTVLSGCPLLTPARTTVDNISVAIRYRHPWATPLDGALGLIGGSSSGGGGWTFEQRNIFRMEPTL
jgi:hypothetical protein